MPSASTTPCVTKQDRFRGILLGTAVGDALGLPAEGLSPRRAKRLFGKSWRHRLMLNRGMISDDTEHTLLVSQCLLARRLSPERFAESLARSLRWWLASLPPCLGWATLRAVFRLWMGYGPARSGVRSAGNAPAMRAAPIGAFFASSPHLLDAYVNAATTITHTDPRALTGAQAVARLVGWIVREDPRKRKCPSRDELFDLLRPAGPGDEEWLCLLQSIFEAQEQNLTVGRFARQLGLDNGVSGYVYHTVPVAVYAWLRHFGDFEDTLNAVLSCGGDTDTTGAIAGALAGALVGESGIPRDWIDGILDWPWSPRLLRLVADRLSGHGAHRDAAGPVAYFWPALPLRNLGLLVVVLAHGLRRLLPPY